LPQQVFQRHFLAILVRQGKGGGFAGSTAEKNARYLAHLRREPERVPDEIARLTSTEKIRLALSRAREKLGPEFRKQFDAIFTWTNLSIMLGFAGGLALAHTVGIGEAVDATLILVLGVDLTLTFLHLCYSIASAQSAVNNAEINECATSIAHDFVTLAESGAFFLLGFGVGKGWKALRKGKNAPSAIPKTAPPSESVPPPETPVTRQPSAFPNNVAPNESIGRKSIEVIEEDAGKARTYPYNRPPTTSRPVPGGGLAAHEAAGGHTMRKHVGRTDAQLAKRLADEPNIPAASTFAEPAIAERAIAEALGAKAADINTWLAGTAPRLNPPLRVNLGYNVGRSLARGAASTTNVQSVLIVLQRDASLPTGYRIVTAYPVP
jgi:hypothetical protein